MSVAARDELLARLSFLAPLFSEKRVLCAGAPEALAEDVGNAIAEHGAAEVTVSHVRGADGSEPPRAVWTDLTDQENGSLDLVLVMGAELLCDDEPWHQELRRCLAPGGRVVVFADNPEVHGAGPGYDDIVACVSPHFPSIELASEIRVAATVLTPYGADPDAMALDASMMSPQEARSWIFVCGDEAAQLSSETVALLDDEEAHPDHDAMLAERDELALRVSALSETVERVKAEGLSEAQTRSLMSEALQNAEQRVEELAARVRRGEAEREMNNDLQRQLDSALLQEEETRRALAEVEGARRFEHDLRVRAERFGGEVEVKYATQKGELAQREMRIKRLVEEVQRLEQDLSQQREESESRMALLTRERDDKRDLSSRLGRDNEVMRAETQRLQALLARARDDLQLMQEQAAQARTQQIAMREALEREQHRAKEANDALIHASTALNQRERSVEELRALLRSHDGLEAQLRHENEALDAQLQQAVQTSAAHRSARERSEAALKGTSSELHRAHGDLSAAHEKIIVLDQRLLTAEAQLREAEARMHETNAEYRLLLTSADSEITSGKHAMERLRAEASATLAERDHAQQERDRVVQELYIALRQVEQGVAEREQAASLHQTDLERIAELEAEAAKLPALRRDLETRSQELLALNDKKGEVETALAFARAEVQRGEKETKETRAAAEQKAKTLETLLAQADAAAKETQRKLEEETKRMLAVSAQLAETERRRAQAAAEAEGHKQKAEGLVANVASVEHALVAKNHALGAAEQQCAALEKERAGLEKERAGLEKERAGLEKERTEALALVATQKGLVEVQKLRVDELSAAAAEAERDRDRIKGELSLMINRMQGLSKEVEEEKQKAGEVLRLLDGERAEILVLRKQLAEARTALREATRESSVGSDLTAPSAPPKKSEEWETLDSFAAEEVLLDGDWADDGKTRVVK